MNKILSILFCIIILVFPVSGQSTNWLKTARVFLIDAYQPPFAPELEYDAEKLAETMTSMHVNVVRFGTMGKYATIQGVRFSTHPDQGSRDLLKETVDSCKPLNIRVVPYISTGHKLAWSMIDNEYPEYAHIASPGGGPERLQMMIGEDHAPVCWMTPYRQAFLDLVEHVVRDYDIDAIYFDTWRPFYFWEGKQTCYCEGCRNGFRKATGYEIPYHENTADYTDDELEIIDKYHHWYYEEFIKIVQQTRRLVKSYKDIPLIYNIDNPVKMANEDPRILKAMDAFLYERGQSMLERAEGVSLAVATGLDVWPYVGVYNNWQRVAYNGFNFQQQILTNMMFGGGSIIAQPYPYVWQPENRHYVSEAFGIIEKLEGDLTWMENDPYIAVIYSYRNPEGHVKNNWWAKADSRSASLGAFAAFLYNHVQVSSVHESILDHPDILKKYSVLYLADMTYVNTSRVENIKSYVKNGGGLIVSYGTSLYDEKDTARVQYGLEDLIRVRPVSPEGTLKEQMRIYSTKIGGPSDLYLLSGSDTALGDYWKDRLVPLWFYEPVKVLDGGRVIMNIVTGDGKRPILPGVVMSSYGKGQVIYCASSLESLFLQDGTYVLGELINKLTQMVAGKNVPYKLNAPATLMANLMKNEDRWLFHMTNWTGNKFERIHRNEYYLAPAENISLDITIPEDKIIKSIEPVIDGPYEKRIEGRVVHLFFPRIKSYQGVLISFD